MIAVDVNSITLVNILYINYLGWWNIHYIYNKFLVNKLII